MDKPVDRMWITFYPHSYPHTYPQKWGYLSTVAILFSCGILIARLLGVSMIDLSTEILSRLQFAFTISFHAIFPTLTIGLGLFLVYWEYRYLQSNSRIYYNLCRFWGKIFALSFGMGVVSGVVLSYELGANFSGFIAFSGNVLGPLIMLETLTAFFLEAGFLGVMLFGWDRVSPRMHFFSTCMVSLGTVISLSWIMSANSFMHTPSGYIIENGVLVTQSWLAVIFNPSFLLRASHMISASILTTSFVIMGVSAFYFFKKRDLLYAKAAFYPALYVACLFSLFQLVSGDHVGLMIYDYQPIKTAAMEANWTTQKRAPLVLFAIPDVKNRINRYEIAIPLLGSFINTHSVNGVLPGLDKAKDKHLPPILPVFFGFRLMVGIGVWFIGLSFWGLYLSRRAALVESPKTMILYMLSAPLGFVATLSGWFVSEIGRQPWTIYYLLTTKEAVSDLPAASVLATLSIIFILYLVFFVTYLYFIKDIIIKGPERKGPTASLGYMLKAVEKEPNSD